jgi:parallel beta-helix repeat protein
MKRRMPCLLVALMLGSGIARATTITSLPAVITKSGHYSLQRDLYYAGTGDAITVYASNVVLDLHGHTLLGPGGPSTGSGVAVLSYQNVTVTNGTISGFAAGVFVNAARCQVTGIRAVSNSSYGIHVDYLGTGSTVSGNECSGSTLAIVCRASHSLILNNNVSRSYQGITLTPGNADITVRGNTTNLNTWGIAVQAGASANTIEQNTALGNSSADLYDGNASCDANIWRNNTFATGNQGCIH